MQVSQDTQYTYTITLTWDEYRWLSCIASVFERPTTQVMQNIMPEAIEEQYKQLKGKGLV